MIDKICFGHSYNITDANRQKMHKIHKEASDLLGSSYEEFTKKMNTNNLSLMERMQGLYDYFSKELEFCKNEDNLANLFEKDFSRVVNEKEQQLKALQEEISYMKEHKHEIISKNMSEKSIAYITNLRNNIESWLKKVM